MSTWSTIKPRPTAKVPNPSYPAQFQAVVDNLTVEDIRLRDDTPLALALQDDLLLKQLSEVCIRYLRSA
jgi:hypothetical protein